MESTGCISSDNHTIILQYYYLCHLIVSNMAIFEGDYLASQGQENLMALKFNGKDFHYVINQTQL